MSNFKVYQDLIELKRLNLRVEKQLRFQQKAEENRQEVLRQIQNTFPLFWSIFNSELELAPAGWFNTNDVYKLGMSGIIFRHHIFIGLKRDSDQLRLYLGVWEQKSYTHLINSYVSRSACDLENMQEDRLEHEAAFKKGLNECISFIKANKISYIHWQD